MKYYALKYDDKKIIVETWDEAKKIISENKNVKYKSFSNKEGALAFLNDEIYIEEVEGDKAYIDGSYNDKTKEYSFGGVLVVNGVEHHFKKKFAPDEYSELRNVAGEIRGAGFIINYAINLGLKHLHIFYDYLGIEKWYDQSWKANSIVAVRYQEFAAEAKKKIQIEFHKVKSHTNDYYNDLADRLAKEALELR